MTTLIDEAQAFAAARLRDVSRPAGLSTGDRALSALAQQRGGPPVTADRVLQRLNARILDVPVR